MKRVFVAIATLTVAALMVGSASAQSGQGPHGTMKSGPKPAALPEVKAVLTSPPLVPPPVDRAGPAKVIVTLETTEAKGRLASDVEYTFWTFGGTVPGPFIRVRVGDTVQIRLKNAKDSLNWHSIDLHAVTGPGGGATVTQVGPGEERVFERKALNPGL